MIKETAWASGELVPRSNKESAAAESATRSTETTPGQDQEVRWQVVATVQGLAQASIIGGRLESEGIPTRVHQEPAGVALGLTVGLLGQAQVFVPEPMVDQALEILREQDQETG